MTNHDGVTVQLTLKELLLLANALNEILNGPDAIEDWEFSTRLGVESAEAKQLLIKFNQLSTPRESPDKE